MGEQHSLLSCEIIPIRGLSIRSSSPTVKLTNQVYPCRKAPQTVVCACPRSLLRTTLEKIAQSGYSAKAGIEYEFCTAVESGFSYL
jgi:glutamine synthetase